MMLAKLMATEHISRMPAAARAKARKPRTIRSTASVMTVLPDLFYKPAPLRTYTSRPGGTSFTFIAAAKAASAGALGADETVEHAAHLELPRVRRDVDEAVERAAG